MGYSSFIILADEREVQLCAIDEPEDRERYLEKGVYYRVSDLLQEGTRMAKRSLAERIIPVVLNGTYSGVSEGYRSRHGQEHSKTLLPNSVSTVFCARLFVQKTESDVICFCAY